MKCAIDLVCLAPSDGGLAVLLIRSPRGVHRLPSVSLGPRRSLTAAAAALEYQMLRLYASWREQCGAQVVRNHPLRADLGMVFVSGFAENVTRARGSVWCALSRLPAVMPACHRAAIDAALAQVRCRADLSPLAFAMLASEFTLTQLQRVYELLLGRSLHKASFRRTVRAARLVVTTSKWRSEGRGRPAQLYRRAARTTPARGVAASIAPFHAPADRRRRRHDTTHA
jgi:8-oxo-dGTP diphosphatase